MNKLILNKQEDRRVRFGHPWIYSNEIDNQQTPLKTFKPGELVIIAAQDQSQLGIAYVNPHSLIAARLLSTQIDEAIDKTFFVKRLQKALTLREQLFSKPFYRLIFSEADLLPGVVIDRFDQHFVVQINTAGMENLTDQLISALNTVFPNVQSILLRNDSSIRAQEGLNTVIKTAFGQTPNEILLEENGVKFFAPLSEGQKTGWFFDHRFNRARLKDYVKDKKVLDVFSYLGGFGIQAALFGASKVDCIDASEFACNYIVKNAKENQIQQKINVIGEDAFVALKNLAENKTQYDVIVVDPPAFVKKFKDKKEGLIAYQRMNELALKLLAPNGLLVSCSCSMHVSLDDLIAVLQRASFKTQQSLQIVEFGHQGPDHPIHLFIPETNYLKAIFARKITDK